MSAECCAAPLAYMNGHLDLTDELYETSDRLKVTSTVDGTRRMHRNEVYALFRGPSDPASIFTTDRGALRSASIYNDVGNVADQSSCAYGTASITHGATSSSEYCLFSMLRILTVCLCSLPPHHIDGRASCPFQRAHCLPFLSGYFAKNFSRRPHAQYSIGRSLYSGHLSQP